MTIEDNWLERLERRLMQAPEPMPLPEALRPDWMPDVPFDRPPVPAAVLVPIVMREEGPHVLYTLRASTLTKHSGQVAFPGGRVDPGDADAAAAALREAREEVDLDPSEAQVLGYMPFYYTGTNYFITPVVALVSPTRPFVANPGEVEAIFEVPLGHLRDVASYGKFAIHHRGQRRDSWRIDHSGHLIWGITANLTRRFRDLIEEDDV